MAHMYADRVKDTFTTTGTGPITVSGSAPTGFRTFSAVCSVGDTVHVTLVDDATGDWETCKATYTASNQLTRSSTDRASSNSGNAVSFGSGTKSVFIAVIAGSLNGSWEQIGPPTVASNAATVDFVLPAGYDRYRIECHNVAPQSDADIRVRTSTNGGSSYDSGASDYDYSGLHISGATITGFNSNGDTAISITPAGTVESAPNMKMSGEIEIINPSAASYCTMKIECRYQRDDGTSYSVWMTGRRATGADVDAVRIFGNGANTNGTFVLLGRRR